MGESLARRTGCASTNQKDRVIINVELAQQLSWNIIWRIGNNDPFLEISWRPNERGFIKLQAVDTRDHGQPNRRNIACIKRILPVLVNDLQRHLSVVLATYNPLVVGISEQVQHRTEHEHA